MIIVIESLHLKWQIQEMLTASASGPSVKQLVLMRFRNKHLWIWYWEIFYSWNIGSLTTIWNLLILMWTKLNILRNKFLLLKQIYFASLQSSISLRKFLPSQNVFTQKKWTTTRKSTLGLSFKQKRIATQKCPVYWVWLPLALFFKYAIYGLLMWSAKSFWSYTWLIILTCM